MDVKATVRQRQICAGLTVWMHNSLLNVSTSSSLLCGALSKDLLSLDSFLSTNSNHRADQCLVSEIGMKTSHAVCVVEDGRMFIFYAFQEKHSAKQLLTLFWLSLSTKAVYLICPNVIVLYWSLLCNYWVSGSIPLHSTLGWYLLPYPAPTNPFWEIFGSWNVAEAYVCVKGMVLLFGIWCWFIYIPID